MKTNGINFNARMKVDWTRERLALRIALDAICCFVLTGVVVIGGFVAIGYFIEWLTRSS